MKKVYLLPNLFTTASLFCGMLAVTKIFQDQLFEACWLILAAALLDAIDGTIARLTRTESAFGVNYDSLADLVAFGVAPALLMFAVLRDEANMKIASGVTTLYAICGALRLARFNVQRTREEKRKFTGLPVPAAAGMVVACFLVYSQIDANELAAKIMPFIIVILSCLMVSKVPYPSHKSIEVERRKPFDYLVSIILVGCIVIALWRYLAYLLFLGFSAYVLYGVTVAVYTIYQRRQGLLVGRRRKRRKEEPRESLPLGR